MSYDEYVRFPGLVCRTPIPDNRNGEARRENLEIVQSYKGCVLTVCKKPDCQAVMIFDLYDEEETWSCNGCSGEAFKAANKNYDKLGRLINERPHARAHRGLDHPHHDARNGDAAA